MSAFVKIGDIEGQATDKNHKGWILLDMLTSSIDRSIPQGAKDSQRTQGETTLGDIVIIRTLDKSTPKLAEACCTGANLDEVKVEICRGTGTKQKYAELVLTGCIVSEYQLSGQGGETGLPMEVVAFNYGKIVWTYIETDRTTGLPLGRVNAGWNRVSNEAV